MGSPLKKKSKLFPANTVTKTIWISTSKPAQSRMERMQRNMSGFRAHTWPVPRHIPTVTGSVFCPGLACPGHYLSLLKYCLSQGSLATTWACWSTSCPRAPWPWPWPLPESVEVLPVPGLPRHYLSLLKYCRSQGSLAMALATTMGSMSLSKSK